MEWEKATEAWAWGWEARFGQKRVKEICCGFHERVDEYASTGECQTNAVCTERNGRHGPHGYDERCLDGKVWRTIPVVMKF